MIKEGRMAGQKPVVNLYPLSNYTFSYRQPKITAEKDNSNAAQLARLRTKYEKEGMLTSVYGILLINERFKLLGGKLKPGENEIDGKKLYLVHLPEHKRFCIPRNRNLICSRRFELFQDMYKNEDPVICYIPDQLSRFQLNMVPENPPDGDNAGNDNEVSSDDNNVAVGDN